MDTVLILNNTFKECGCHSYGERINELLQKSEKYNFIYLEADSLEQVLESIKKNNVKICLINYHADTMFWLDLSKIKCPKIAIPHEFPHSGFDHVVSLITKEQESDTVSHISRPLLEYPINHKKNDVITIGSCGFGFSNKNFDKLCEIVNYCYDEAVINLHITDCWSTKRYKQAEMLKSHCMAKITKPKITLNVTTEYVSDEELVTFLSKNDINIFLYDLQPERGQASILDYAISAGRPIGLSNSYMFHHLGEFYDNMNLSKNSIEKIIVNGNSDILKLQEKWSNKNFIKDIENIIQKCLNRI